jgi:hypothetical protein
MIKRIEKKKFREYRPDQYIEVRDLQPRFAKFPKEISIAYAVCGKRCGKSAFIVDGQSQVCEYCGKNMFRTEVIKYVRKKTKGQTQYIKNA